MELAAAQGRHSVERGALGVGARAGRGKACLSAENPRKESLWRHARLVLVGLAVEDLGGLGRLLGRVLALGLARLLLAVVVVLGLLAVLAGKVLGPLRGLRGALGVGAADLALAERLGRGERGGGGSCRWGGVQSSVGLKKTVASE